MGQPWPLFVYFRSFTEKTVGVSRTLTLNVGVEGEYADHLTTTTAHIVIPQQKKTHSLEHSSSNLLLGAPILQNLSFHLSFKANQKFVGFFFSISLKIQKWKECVKTKGGL